MYNTCIYLPLLDTEKVRDIFGKCDKVYEMIFMMKREFFKKEVERSLEKGKTSIKSKRCWVSDNDDIRLEIIQITDGNINEVLENAINDGYVNISGLDKMVELVDKIIRENISIPESSKIQIMAFTYNNANYVLEWIIPTAKKMKME